MTQSYARYEFSGIANVESVEGGEIIKLELGCEKIAFAYLFTQQGICSRAVISKDQARVMCFEMHRDGLISADDAAIINGQIDACQDLPETWCAFTMHDVDDDGKISARIRSFQIVQNVYSKQFALWHLDQVEQQGNVYARTKDVMCQQVKMSNLPESCAAIAREDGRPQINDTNGEQFGYLLYSFEQGMMTLKRLKETGQLTDDHYTQLRHEMISACRAANLPSFTSQLQWSHDDGDLSVMIITSEPVGQGDEWFSKVTAHKEIEKYIATHFISAQRGSALHEEIDSSELPHSTACFFSCEQGHWHLIDEFNRILTVEIHSKRQAIDQLNEATRNEKFYVLSHQRVEKQIMESDMPDTHESDNEYLHKHAKDCGLFTDLVH